MSTETETLTWTDQKLIYNLLSREREKGYTAAEIEREIRRTGCHRRLSEMETMGLARKSGSRTCTVANKKAAVWFWDDSSAKPPKIKVQQAHKIKVLEDRVKYLETENAKLKQELYARTGEKY
jgi:hypothetical protein